MFRRIILTMSVILAATTGLGVLVGGPALASSAPVRPQVKAAGQAALSRLRHRQVRVRLDALAPAVRRQLTRADKALVSGDAASVTATAQEFVVYADNQCLNANSAGPSAGQNGDKVQLWNCYSSYNELWIPVQASGNYYYLVSAQYPGMCLNADYYDGGIGNGHPVQLWNCYSTDLEWWDFGDWYNSVYGAGVLSPLYLSIGPDWWCLDANEYALGNGDNVQLWNYWGGYNQLWY